MKRFLRDHNLRDLLRRHPQLTAYLLIVVATIGGFLGVRHVQRVSDQRICRAVITNREVLRTLINRQGTASAPPGSSPELVRAYEQSSQQAAAFREYANHQLDGVRCPH